MQHDAHEFFNHLLNSIHHVLLEEKKAEKEKKRLLGHQMASGGGIKKDRPSFFSRRRGKSSKLSGSVSVLNSSKSGPDTATPLTDNSSSYAPYSEGVYSNDSPALTGDERTDLTSELTEDDPSTDSKHLNTNVSSAGRGKSSSFSIFSRIRQSKKVSTSSKSSEESETSQMQSKLDEDPSEDTTTWIYDIFQGTYTTITRCLNCETVRIKGNAL